MPDKTPSTATLLIACPDRPGLIAEVTGLVASLGGNIIDADQHTDADSGQFFMRLAIGRQGVDRGALESGARGVAQRCSMQRRLNWRDEPMRVAILVSKQGHCLADLLFRWRSGELEGDIALVVGDLDEGPIIAQATTTVGHRDTVNDLIRKGRDLERIVLADAVRAHLQDRILVSGGKTVVFE